MPNGASNVIPVSQMDIFIDRIFPMSIGMALLQETGRPIREWSFRVKRRAFGQFRLSECNERVSSSLATDHRCCPFVFVASWHGTLCANKWTREEDRKEGEA